MLILNNNYSDIMDLIKNTSIRKIAIPKGTILKCELCNEEFIIPFDIKGKNFKYIINPIYSKHKPDCLNLIEATKLNTIKNIVRKMIIEEENSYFGKKYNIHHVKNNLYILHNNLTNSHYSINYSLNSTFEIQLKDD